MLPARGRKWNADGIKVENPQVGFNPLGSIGAIAYFGIVSTVQEIESAIRALPRIEVEKLRDRIDELLEDERELTDEFRASIERGKRDIKEGRARVR